MTANENEPVFGSTTWEWRKVKIGRPAGGQRTARSSSYGWRRLSRQDRRQKVRVTFSWKGGAESRWLVEARGQHAVICGWYCIEDLLSLICNEN